MADEKEKYEKPDYYYTVVVAHPVPEKGAELFDRKCSEYEAMHEVKYRSSGMAYANSSFVFMMTFCCDGDDGGGPYASR